MAQKPKTRASDQGSFS